MVEHFKSGRIHDDLEEESKKDIARKRWKILCLIKTSDTISDETARKERVQERVDEWMSSLAGKMRLNCHTYEEESKESGGVTLLVNGSFETEAGSWTRSSMSSNKSEKEKEHERLQNKRILKRIEEEQNRERKLVLQGKIKVTSEFKNDPGFKLKQEMKEIRQKVAKRKNSKREVSPKPKTSLTKWKKALEVVNSVDQQCFEEKEDTLIANLYYDEATDELMSQENKYEENNPVFKAFEEAKNVDDLYRIAEVWVSPNAYLQHF